METWKLKPSKLSGEPLTLTYATTNATNKMPKQSKANRRKTKIKQGLRDPNKDRNDGISKNQLKQPNNGGGRSKRERFFSSWLKKSQRGGFDKGGRKSGESGKSRYTNPVDANDKSIGKKRQRDTSDGQQQDPPRRRTARERYADDGTSGKKKDGKRNKSTISRANAANAESSLQRSHNPLADKRSDESLLDFQIRKAKEQRSIVAKEEYNGTKRAAKVKKYREKRKLKEQEKLEARRAKGYDSEEDERNAAAGVSQTRAVAFGERIEDAPRIKNMPKSKWAKRKKVVTLVEGTATSSSSSGSGSGKKGSGQSDQIAALRAHVVEAYRASRQRHVMGPGSSAERRR